MTAFGAATEDTATLTTAQVEAAFTLTGTATYNPLPATTTGAVLTNGGKTLTVTLDIGATVPVATVDTLTSPAFQSAYDSAASFAPAIVTAVP